jgi:hypothetical protein
MTRNLFLRRKWTLRAHGEKVVFVKRSVESARHVVMKALLWALYLPQYPDLVVEISIGDRYKPDVVSLDRWGDPRFWGEAGEVGVDKIRSLVRRYRRTHFALAKWDTALDPYTDLVAPILEDVRREAPFDLIAFTADSAERFIDDSGEITVSFDDLDWVRFPGEGSD